MNLRNFSSVTERRQALEKEQGVRLENIGTGYKDEITASSKNCENMIGIAQIPLGVAGPLRVKLHASNFKFQEKEYYVPLATTEGALIASVNRGCKVIQEAGGATAFVEQVGTTRGPVFRTTSLSQSMDLKQWIQDHESELAALAQQTSSHICLLSQLIRVEGTLVFVRFAFDTQDAMGMNMVTIATEVLGQRIAAATKTEFLTVSANFCVDKKPSWQNAILGRGWRAWSEVCLPTNVIIDLLKTSPDILIDVWQSKCLIGGAISGSMGFNGHAANVIAALFLATGQDVAHVVEGSTAMTTIQKTNEGVLVNVTLPSVLVGTVGGGTTLATQQEALSLLGIAGSNSGKHAEELAGVAACAVLAGEISELAALSNHTLTRAHQTLGRGA